MKFIYLLLTYNHEEFIKETFSSTINQSRENFDLVISDDSSTDNTFKILTELVNDYDGEINIRLVKTNTNLGTIKHINSLIKNYPADYYIVGAGDDIALENKVDECIFAANKGIKFVASNPIVIDKLGTEIGRFHKKELSYSIYDAIDNANCGMFVNAFSADLINQFGEIDFSLSCEDQTLSFRSLLLSNGIINTVGRPLVKYRSHDNNQVKSLHLRDGNLSGKEYLGYKILLRYKLLESWVADSRKLLESNYSTALDIHNVIQKLEGESEYYKRLYDCLTDDNIANRLKSLRFNSFKKTFLHLLICISSVYTGILLRALIKIKWWLRKEPIGY